MMQASVCVRRGEGGCQVRGTWKTEWTLVAAGNLKQTPLGLMICLMGQVCQCSLPQDFWRPPGGGGQLRLPVKLS